MTFRHILLVCPRFCRHRSDRRDLENALNANKHVHVYRSAKRTGKCRYYPHDPIIRLYICY